MRLKSSIFVSALMRRENAKGSFSTILNKGAEEAGAIFLVHLQPNGNADFYGPAPQSAFGESGETDRWFEVLGRGLDASQIDERIRSQLRFDPDCWIVEIEKSGLLEDIQVLPE